MSMLLSAEPTIRIVAFLGVFIVIALAEARWPRRKRSHHRLTRWPSNLGMVGLDNLLVRLLVPLVPVALALQLDGSGLFGVIGLTRPASILAAVVLMDLAIYWQHVLFHRVPILWRLHRLHHTDTDYDATTALRFHPVEILLSIGIKLAVIAVLGAPAEGVILFEVLLNATAMFNHGNLKLPERVDAALRLVLVTPDFHRVHHSDIPEETHSNFGFSAPWWDYMFGTYVAQPKLGHEGMTIGLPMFRAPEELRLDRLLTQPFREPAAAPVDETASPTA